MENARFHQIFRKLLTTDADRELCFLGVLQIRHSLVCDCRAPTFFGAALRVFRDLRIQ